MCLPSKLSLKKLMKGVSSEMLCAEGLLTQDWSAITPCQAACTDRLGKTLQLEQEHYLLQHPEVKAMLEIFISKMVLKRKMKDILKEATEHFARPVTELDEEVRQKLNLLPEEPYNSQIKCGPYQDERLKEDLREIIDKYYPLKTPTIPTPSVSTINTASSSFLSLLTSDTTLATPEPIPTPEPTFSEVVFNLVSNTVDKAIYLRVDDEALNYDTAYIELRRAVEEAMEVPVIEIKKDIAELYFNSYRMFEFEIMEQERIAAEKAWEKRMRKKLKRTLRRLDNFKEQFPTIKKFKFKFKESACESSKTRVNKTQNSRERNKIPSTRICLEQADDTRSDSNFTAGFVTPPTPKSEISSHESYKIAPPHPCICHPQFHYNRYPKDRFGIYMPNEQGFSDCNVTVTPDIVEETDDTGDEHHQVTSLNN